MAKHKRVTRSDRQGGIRIFRRASGLPLAQMDVTALPAEEPPQIEFDEDAGGQEADDRNQWWWWSD